MRSRRATQGGVRPLNRSVRPHHGDLSVTIDATVRITDIVMILAVIAGPIIAVQITEYLRTRQDQRLRKVHLFRTLMATRSATMTPAHIEALNLVEIEFISGKTLDREVLDSWKLYLAHLNDINYPKDSWGARRADLLVDLLYSMSKALHYDYDKAHIKSGAYYPQGYGESEAEQIQIRKLTLEILKGTRGLPVSAVTIPTTAVQDTQKP
jgi:hypothetical protein